MVNNIAVNVLGGGPDTQGTTHIISWTFLLAGSSQSFKKRPLEVKSYLHFVGNASSHELNMTEPSAQLETSTQTTASDLTAV